MSIQPVEIVHMSLAVAGFAFSLWNVQDSFGDLKALHFLNVNSAAETTARGSLRNELLRTAQFACLIGVGLVAFILPPGSESNTAPRVWALALFIVFDVLIATNTFLTMLTRRRIFAQLGMKRGPRG